MWFNRYNLIEAVKNNDINRVNSILNNGKANINAKDRDGWTALIWASCKGDLEITKLLVENGADIDAKDNEGWSALMEASYEGHLKVVKYLVEKGIDRVNVKDNDGWTALMRASWRGYLEIVQYLVEIGADINIKNKDGKTALDWADIEEIKEILRKAGAK